jgi:chorismate dehydratase
VLAQILLSQRWGIAATFEQLDPQTAASLVSVPAAVLIGDPALKATLVDGPANDWNVVDLGQAWFEWTSLPMVFAVWAARRDFAQAHPEQLASVRATFTAGLDQAHSQPLAVADAAAQISDFSPDQLQEYFLGLDFGLSAQARSGIAEFSARLAGFSADFGARSLDFLPSLEPI